MMKRALNFSANVSERIEVEVGVVGTLGPLIVGMWMSLAEISGVPSLRHEAMLGAAVTFLLHQRRLE